MNRCRNAVLHVGLLLVCVSAYAAVKNAMIRITVVDSETHSVSLGDNGVPVNCDQVNFDAYCHNSKSAQVTNTLLVQEGNQPPFRVSCAVESKWSRCVPLPKGQSFEARREKRGISVYYADDNGKLRQQLYTYVGGAPSPAASGVATGSTGATSAAPATGGALSTAAPAAANATAANATPATASAPAAAQPAPAAQSASATQESVKCSFSSTPPGAEVTVDGRYVGSTPSVLSLSTGNHTVEVSLPGFARWKRELTVSPGSELTVNAVLEKAQ